MTFFFLSKHIFAQDIGRKVIKFIRRYFISPQLVASGLLYTCIYVYRLTCPIVMLVPITYQMIIMKKKEKEKAVTRGGASWWSLKIMPSSIKLECNEKSAKYLFFTTIYSDIFHFITISLQRNRQLISVITKNIYIKYLVSRITLNHRISDTSKKRK